METSDQLVKFREHLVSSTIGFTEKEMLLFCLSHQLLYVSRYSGFMRIQKRNFEGMKNSTLYNIMTACHEEMKERFSEILSKGWTSIQWNHLETNMKRLKESSPRNITEIEKDIYFIIGNLISSLVVPESTKPIKTKI